MKTIQSILCALMVAALSLSVARAEDKPEPPAKVGAAKFGKTITIEQLGQILEEHEFNPKPYKNSQGEVAGYNVSFTSGTWRIAAWVYLSPDRTTMYFYSEVMGIDGKAPVPSEVLLQMLRENASIAPATSYIATYSDGTQAVLIRLPVTVEGCTPGAISMKMLQFGEQIKKLITAKDKALAVAKDKAKAKDEKAAPNLP